MRLRLAAFLGCVSLSVVSVHATAKPSTVSLPVKEEGGDGSRPAFGSAPSWVLPASIPATPTAGQGAAIINLLADTQIHLSGDTRSYYYNWAYRIGTARGLEDGAIQINWDPALDRVIIHRIHLIRDGKVIDLLGDGSALSVIRREKNLEQASLDGELTALIQPDDLRVGDIIDYAYTTTRRDPAMGGHAEFVLGPNDGTTIGRHRIRILWEASRKVAWRAMPGVIQPKLRQVGQETELLSDLSNVTTKLPPQGAPSRFLVVNTVLVSDFDSWASVASVLEPLYAKAAQLAPDSPLKVEAARIAASTNDPRARAEQALALVEEKVRYLFLEMNGGGYMPANADTTWSRRYGDCKGKTVLLISLLKELGIPARPVLVSTTNGDFVAERLPSMGAFDHVLVEATIGGRSYWLDGTRLGDRRLDLLTTPNYKVGLPIVARDARLISMTPEPLRAPTEAISLALDASAGLDVPAPAVAELRYSGDDAVSNRLKYSDLSATDRDQELRKFWRKNYDFITPLTVGMKDDEATGAFVLTMSGTAKMDWAVQAGTRWYELDGSRVGWKIDTVRDDQLNPDAPFAFNHPDWWSRRETIKLPRGGEGFRLQADAVDEQVGGLYAFHRSVRIDKDVMTMETSTKSLASELPASKANATRARMAELAEVASFVRVPEEYIATDGDIAALKADKPALAKALLKRGALRYDRRESDLSLADIDASLALDQSQAPAFAIRAMLLAAKGDAKATEAADRALALDSKSWMARNAKGFVALNAKRFAEAEAEFEKSLEIEPKFAHSMVGRGTARLAQNKSLAALADFDAAYALDPTLALMTLRIATLANLGRFKDALDALDAALAKDAMDSEARTLRAQVKSAMGDTHGAIADYDVLIAQKPQVDLYLDRAALAATPKDAAADIDAALRLEPRSVVALAARAQIEIKAGMLDRAETDLATIDQIKPGDRTAAATRMQLLIKKGKPTDALRIADGVVAKYGDSTAYNERCWTKATLNLAIDTALADCEKALQLEPSSAAALDSRGFVKLRRGAQDEAIADYDAALRAVPGMAASLYGRGIARARKGDRAGALADLTEARRIAPEIEARFASYGMTIPAGFGAN